MRTPEELARRDLIEIVTEVQQALYLDRDSQVAPIWNPDKPWNGAEVCNQLADLLARHDLLPGTVMPARDGAT